MDSKICSPILMYETAGLVTIFATRTARVVSFEASSLEALYKKIDSGLTGI
jgi:hypothetical protein